MCKSMTGWIRGQRTGPFSLNGNQPTSNVFIADFIELKNSQFPRAVISLNEKLFRELTMSSGKTELNGFDAEKSLVEKLKDIQNVSNCNKSNETIVIQS